MSSRILCYKRWRRLRPEIGTTCLLRTRPTSDWPVVISLENAAEGDGAAEPSDLFAQSIRSQEIAHPSARADNAQNYAVARKLRVEIVQHARAGEIEVG